MIVGVSPLQFILWHFIVMAFCLLMKCKGFSFKIRLGTLETILLGGCHHIGNYKVILFKQQGPYKAKQNRHTHTPTELCFMPVVSYPTLSFAEKKIYIFFPLYSENKHGNEIRVCCLRPNTFSCKLYIPIKLA